MAMGKLRQAIDEIYAAEQQAYADTYVNRLDPRAKITVTFVFLVCLLSLPLHRISAIIPFFAFPIILAARANISYGTVFKQSLISLPFVFAIGIFNPLLDRQTAFAVGTFAISYGWISFFSIILRGILSVQAAVLLIRTAGFYNMCLGLEKMGLPSLFTTQLLLVYRYIFVLVKDFGTMLDAYRSRSFGEKNAKLKFWSKIVGHLMIRSIERSDRIYEAMVARGFAGKITGLFVLRWTSRDTVFVCFWSAALIVFRVFLPIEALSTYIVR